MVTRILKKIVRKMFGFAKPKPPAKDARPTPAKHHEESPRARPPGAHRHPAKPAAGSARPAAPSGRNEGPARSGREGNRPPRRDDRRHDDRRDNRPNGGRGDRPPRLDHPSSPTNWSPHKGAGAAAPAAHQAPSAPPPPAAPAVPETPWDPAQFQVAAQEGKVRFHDLPLPSPIMRAIQDLGFEYCTPIQGKSLPLSLAGKDVAGRAQTGTGKTAAFLLAILKRFAENPIPDRPFGTPRALVLAPTRELVVQIDKDAAKLSKHSPVNTLAVYGGMEFKDQRRKLSEGRIDLIAATPGRLLDFCGRSVINLRHIEVLVIDEADRMLDMGFIPDIRRILRQLPPREQRQTMLFSATLSEDVMRLASQWMRNPEIVEVESETVTVDTVKQIVYAVSSRDKLRLMLNLMEKEKMERVLIFSNRRDETRELTERLHKKGVHCELLSGDVPQDRRMKVLEAFRAGKIRVLVATDVAGRGIHVDGISHVINYNLPYEPEEYVHRIGRTGRVGHEGTAISFACEDESFVLPEIEKFIGREIPVVVPDTDLLPPLK
ncbi:MAG: DEAD/DEAH box helicase [Kiritimatiellia bacterium]